VEDCFIGFCGIRVLFRFPDPVFVSSKPTLQMQAARRSAKARRALEILCGMGGKGRGAALTNKVVTPARRARLQASAASPEGKGSSLSQFLQMGDTRRFCARHLLTETA
jgi:hypothetical protein